jgi:hypothetical protein
MKMTVGVTRHVGAEAGTRGASMQLEVEVDADVLTDPQRWSKRTRQLYAMVRTAVDAELMTGANNNNVAAVSDAAFERPVNGKANGAVRSATPAQLQAIRALARQQGLDLAAELQARFQVQRPEQLDIRQASGLIDSFRR